MKTTWYRYPAGFTLVIGALVIGVLMIWNTADINQTASNQADANQTNTNQTERKRRLRGDIQFNAPDRFAEYHKNIRTKKGASAPDYPPNYQLKALQKAFAHAGKAAPGTYNHKQTPVSNLLNWQERGPINVSGRARAVLVDPDDTAHRIWYIGTAGGGVWKTEDAGESWRELTRDLPNLSTTTLAMSPANTNTIYAGTGEGYGSFSFIYGSGIWKSTDKGESWEQLESTAENPSFTNVMRLIVDDANPNHLVAATSTGLRSDNSESSYIFRSTNGGTSWTQVYESPHRVEQVIATPENFQIQYAAVHGKGILKSTDAGASWEEDFDDFAGVGRMELAIAPSDPNWVYASADGGIEASTLYLSPDAGATWGVIDTQEENATDWLGDLGWYCQSLTVNPGNKNHVFAGGINLYQLHVDSTTDKRGDVDFVIEYDPNDLYQLHSHLSAPAIAARLGQQSEVNTGEFTEVEIRWGPGRTQKAHSFANKWLQIYKDYVEVNFEVWDITNNRQLMVAFEDLDNDNQWDIKGGLVDASERMLILGIPYTDTPHTPTTQNAFHSAHYMVNVFSNNSENTSGPFTEATLTIIPRIRDFRTANLDQVTSSSSGDPVTTKGVHVDHHQLQFIADENLPFPIFLDANDGGVAVSYDMGATFQQTGDTFSQLFANAGSSQRPFSGLNTAQFYGVDKMNGADRYVGGSQDNGSWVSPDMNSNTEPWQYAPSSDGFEAAWHYQNPDWIIQTSQFNRFIRSLDGGKSWQDISPGGFNVFLTRLAKSNQNPDLIFATIPDGILRSTDFGSSWERKTLVPQLWPSGSSPTVRISLASSDIVWAGSELGGNTPFFVSENSGQTFTAVAGNGLTEARGITNIATHPSDPFTAYALFSQSGSPKIMQTANLGGTWTDISGFGTGNASTTGFPDVAVYSLLVMPYDEQILWAGTEIGLFESTDGGQSWQYADNGLPAVAIWQMRIVNDQVVVATHGRGIWSVTLPELANYEPANIQLVPAITDINGGAAGNLVLDIHLRAAYDSTQIWVGGQRVSLPANSAPETLSQLFTAPISQADTVDAQVIGFKEGIALPSQTKPAIRYPLEAPASDFVSTFNQDGTELEFWLDGFQVTRTAGLTTPSLHSPHPYPDFFNATAVVRTPVVIDGTDPLLIFDEITWIEAGKPGVSFGQPDFYDYAIVEGSVDEGLTWQPLLYGYDVRAYSDWDSTQVTNTPAHADYRKRTINLLDTFTEGDEVLIRFRLSSDNAGTGWGWTIDNVHIQSSETVSTESVDIPNAFTLEPAYPNPFASSLNVRFSLPQNDVVNMVVYNTAGQRVQWLVQGQQLPAGSHTITWNGNTFWGNAATGTYFIQIEAGPHRVTRPVVKVR